MVYFLDIMYFQMIHIMLFQPITHTDNIIFVKFPKGICVAKQQRFFDHIFPNMINFHLQISNLLQDLIKIQSK